MRNFQILIVSAVKFCKYCLQTSSFFEGHYAPGHYRDPTRGLPSPAPDLLSYSPHASTVALALPGMWLSHSHYAIGLCRYGLVFVYVYHRILYFIVVKTHLLCKCWTATGGYVPAPRVCPF